MNRQEYENYRKLIASEPEIRVSDLDEGDHTLAYGYTVDRNTWHAYVMDDQIHVIIYDHNSDVLFHRNGSEMPASMLRPSKRVYPDTVNDTFARLMLYAGEALPFLGNFDFESPVVAERAKRKPFVGRTHLDFFL